MRELAERMTSALKARENLPMFGNWSEMPLRKELVQCWKVSIDLLMIKIRFIEDKGWKIRPSECLLNAEFGIDG